MHNTQNKLHRIQNERDEEADEETENEIKNRK